MSHPSRVPSETLDPIPSPVRAVLNLFDAELEGVTFPGLDAEILETHAEAVRERAHELEEARRSLEEARVQLEAAQEQLLLQAKKGHAYATIFAETDPALKKTLETIVLDPAAARAPVKRGRKAGTKAAKAKSNVEELPLDRQQAADDEDAAPVRAVG